MAWLVSLVAIAATRQLNPNVLFFHSRYVAVVAFAPAILIGAAIVARSYRWSLLLLPVAAILCWKVPATYERTIDQEEDIRHLHTEPARFATRELPDDAVLLVEGAGALRYFTPRSMAVIDFIGLNARAIVHQPDDASRYCEVLTRRISHVVVPDSLLRQLTQLYRTTLLQTFVEENYAQSIQSYRRTVSLLRVIRPDPRASRACALRRQAADP